MPVQTPLWLDLAAVFTSAVLGALGLRLAAGAVLAVALTTALRSAAVRRGWEAPVPADAVTQMRRTVARRR
jgi:hypothetical protein